jgi:hypothetical protein
VVHLLVVAWATLSSLFGALAVVVALAEHGSSAGDDGDGDDDERRLDRVAHLLGATVEAVRVAVIARNRIAAELAAGRAVA